jgi:hypothetical protein
MGKVALGQDFWKSLPKDERPGENTTYQYVLDLQSNLKDEIEAYEKLKPDIRSINEELTHAEYDLRLIEDGHMQTSRELVTFASDDWLQVKQPVKETRPKKTLFWADASSSSEDELLISAISSLSKESPKKTPGIDLPEDFAACFPAIAAKLSKTCNTFNWDCRYVKGTNLRAQGLVQFQETETGDIKSDHLTDSNRIALASLYAAAASLSVQPQCLVAEDDTEVAVTYVCSLIAQRKLGAENPELMKIALKNGDGGQAVLRGRFFSLTKTGSSAMKLVIEAMEKLLDKFARELSIDLLKGEVLKQVTDRSFTSLDGMMENSYRTTLVESFSTEERTDRRGKLARTKVKVKKLHKIVPDLSTGSYPLKPSEVTRINNLRDAFNNRKAEIETRLGKVSESTFLDRPRICREVVQEAYTKLQAFKSLMKDRVVKIRERATALNNGNKPGPVHWTTAKTEILKDTPDIPDSVWDEIAW